MKTLLATLILTCIPGVTVFAGGSSEVGNGGGLAEKNLTFAYQNLDRFITLCEDTPMCRLSSNEALLLTKIRTALPKERANTSQLTFHSSKTDPTFFKIDDVIRVAKTGDHVGDPIYINSDLLYTRVDSQSGGEYRAMDIPLAVSVLIHELGHHQGVKNHTSLDALGSKLQALLLSDSERSEFWNGNASLLTFQFNHVHSDAEKKDIRFIDEVILENESEFYSLTDSISKSIQCPKSSKNKKLHALRIYNLHGERGIQFDSKTRLLTKPFRAWYILSCEAGKESDHGDFEIDLSFKKQGPEKWEFVPEKTKVLQMSCFDKKEVCK